MPKRSAKEKIERYSKKIRKLQEAQKSRQNSSDDERVQEYQNVEDFSVAGPALYDPTPDEAAETADERAQQSETVPIETNAQPPLPAQTDPPATEVNVVDPVLLSALGAATSESSEYGDPIHDSLASLWTPLLKKGLPKEDRDKLLKEYLVPDNCKLLQAPKLNAEISSAVSDIVRGRDKKILQFQQQLGSGLTAINRAMHLLLTDDKAQALKHLSAGCRLLSDGHFAFTNNRQNFDTLNIYLVNYIISEE